MQPDKQSMIFGFPLKGIIIWCFCMFIVGAFIDDRRHHKLKNRIEQLENIITNAPALR